MQPLKGLRPGAMFWADRDHLAEIKAMGVDHGQIGIPGGMELNDTVAADWKAALEQEQFTLVTAFAAFNGESYADIPTVEQTVGFIPLACRAERERRTMEVCDFAALLGIPSVACHVGFVPHDKSNPDYLAVRDLVRRLCDRAASHGQTFALETGQEPAPVLWDFLKDVDRPNVGINFDPANMILYGTGDPIEALDVLGSRLLSVHAKDGDWPPPHSPGALGHERPLGQGAVGMERFVKKLREVQFQGPLNVERETEDQQQRLIDMAMGIQLLEGLLGGKA